MARLHVMTLVGILVLAACGGDVDAPHHDLETAASDEWKRIAGDALDEMQRSQLERALAAKDFMAGNLMEELSSELALGGPSGAVVVCRDMAPMIAEHAADEHGLAIGRTSHRLRNPANTAPIWAGTLVEERVPEPAYLAGPAGELGVMLPIRVAPPCLACHGRPEDLDAEVTAALAESYPTDQAVGFAAGDLRGWFWIEVPGA